ncbi:hypothetical protein [Lactobacillus delbrueckii]|uniref:hypothetical protein n=1 Tax=Lactobacillus delbrueckii TaxID=1584 RepID=UPI0025B0E597|nr:hypothetical protein [Lactobacillus delbrueckii]
MDFIKAIWDLYPHTRAETFWFIIASAEFFIMGPWVLKLYHKNRKLTNQLGSSSVDRMHIQTGNIDIDLAGQPASNLSNEQEQLIRAIASGTINNISQKESTTNEN